jgi:hypothetical protein
MKRARRTTAIPAVAAAIDSHTEANAKIAGNVLTIAGAA